MPPSLRGIEIELPQVRFASTTQRKLFHRDRAIHSRAGKGEEPMIAAVFRLRKHADYQRVYAGSRKQFAKQMSYFFLLRPALGPDGTAIRDVSHGGARVGLTVGKVMGKAVDRNRIKRRMREAVRRHVASLHAPVDVVLHPRRTVMDLEFAALEREVGTVFRAIQKAVEKQKQPRMRADEHG